MAAAHPQDWTLGFDELNRVCWYNKATKAKFYPQAPQEATAGLSAINGAGPNIPAAASFTPATGLVYETLVKEALAGAWKEYQTDDDKKTYWYNKITKETKWEKPTTVSPTKPPPPPPAQPPTETKKEKDEKDQWKQLYNNKGVAYCWYNEVTRKSQFERPSCLNKYH